MKKKDIAIDADGLLFLVAGNAPVNDLEGDNIEDDIPVELKFLKKKFKMIVHDLVTSVEVESIWNKWKPGKIRLIFSDPDHNFRKDLDPGYKANRKHLERSPEFYALRDWAHKRYEVAKGCEADDLIARYVRKGAVGISMDKDLLQGVPGIWFNNHFMHKTWHTTTKEDSIKFTAMQTLAGDSTDNIKGLTRVGLKTAEKLLAGDYSWQNIVNIYKSKGMTEEDAILTRRLIGMDQYKKKGIKLWTP